ncbi:unnamed protein product, partial [Prorocentrum cordatum]
MAVKRTLEFPHMAKQAGAGKRRQTIVLPSDALHRWASAAVTAAAVSDRVLAELDVQVRPGARLPSPCKRPDLRLASERRPAAPTSERQAAPARRIPPRGPLPCTLPPLPGRAPSVHAPIAL